MAREQLDSVVEFTTPRRRTSGDRARELLDKSRDSGERGSARAPKTGSGEQYKKVTGRVFEDQQQWFQSVPKGFNKRHPRQPRLTGDELMRIAIEYLRKAEDIDAVIEEMRK